MSTRWQAVPGLLLAAILVVGCSLQRSLDSRIESNQPLTGRLAVQFRKHELTTRQWLGLDGAPMNLVSFEVLAVSNRSPLAIARYGDKASGRAYCLDFYEHYESRDPNDPVLGLLCHDARSGWVRNVQVEYQRGEVYLTVTRDFESGTSNDYSYRYSDENGFTPMLSDFWTPPREKATRK